METLKPINLRSEKDLAGEFQNFYKLLEDTETDWSKRLSAIKRLKGILIGDSPNIDGFMTYFNKLSPQLTAQLNDLRSQITKEAGSLVCMAADILGEKMESLADKLLTKEALMKIINSGNKVIAENGHLCVVSLLENVSSVKSIPRILDEFNSKNQAVRVRCSQYLNIILRNYPNPLLEKTLPMIENVIEQGVLDASKETRAYSRRNFLLFQELYPLRADKIFSRFDASTQKILQEETKNGGSASSKKSSSKSSSAKPEPFTRTSSAAGQEEIATTAPVSNAHRRLFASFSEKEEDREKAQPVVKKYSAEDDKLAKTAPSRVSSSSSSLRRNMKSANGRENNNNANKEDDIDIGDQKNVFSSIDKGGKPPVLMRKKEPKCANSKENPECNDDFNDRSNSSKRQSPGYAEVHNNRYMNEDTVRNSSTLKSITSLPDKTSSKQGKLADEGKQKGLNEEKKAHKKTDSLEFQKVESKSVYQSMREEDLEFLIEKAENANWATRAISFEKISELLSEINEEGSDIISSPVFDKIMVSHIAHLQDSHFKVILAALTSTTKLITFYKENVFPYLDRLITNILCNLTDSKDKVYSKANILMNLIQKIYSGDEIIAPLLKAFEQTNKLKVKICALEALIIVIKDTEGYFSNYSNVKNVIFKLANIITENLSAKTVLMPCLGVILSIRDKQFNYTLSSIIALTPNLLSNLRLIAAQHAPDLEENIRNHLTLYSGPNKDNVARESGKYTVKPQTKNAKDFSLRDQETNDGEEENERGYQNAFSSKGTQPTVNGHEEDEEEEGEEVEEVENPGNDFDQNYRSERSGVNLMHNTNEKNFPLPKTNNFLQKEEGLVAPTNDLTNYYSHTRAQLKGQQIEGQNKLISETENNKKGNELEDLKKIEVVLRDPRANKELLTREANILLATLLRYLESETPKVQDLVFKLMRRFFEAPSLDLSSFITQDSVYKLLNLYHLNLQANIQIDELFELMIERVNKQVYMRALVDRLSSEKTPILQTLIRLASQIVKSSKESEMKPCLDGLIEVFKKAIKDQSPDVRKSVVFCLVDLYFLFYNKLEPYLQMFDPTQQKLVSIYIKRRQDHLKNQI